MEVFYLRGCCPHVDICTSIKTMSSRRYLSFLCSPEESRALSIVFVMLIESVIQDPIEQTVHSGK
jgi:hypothetical protein